MVRSIFYISIVFPTYMKASERPQQNWKICGLAAVSTFSPERPRRSAVPAVFDILHAQVGSMQPRPLIRSSRFVCMHVCMNLCTSLWPCHLGLSYRRLGITEGNTPIRTRWRYAVQCYHRPVPAASAGASDLAETRGIILLLFFSLDATPPGR